MSENEKGPMAIANEVYAKHFNSLYRRRNKPDPLLVFADTLKDQRDILALNMAVILDPISFNPQVYDPQTNTSDIGTIDQLIEQADSAPDYWELAYAMLLKKDTPQAQEYLTKAASLQKSDNKDMTFMSLDTYSAICYVRNSLYALRNSPRKKEPTKSNLADARNYLEQAISLLKDDVVFKPEQRAQSLGYLDTAYQAITAEVYSPATIIEATTNLKDSLSSFNGSVSHPLAVELLSFNLTTVQRVVTASRKEFEALRKSERPGFEPYDAYISSA